MRRIHCTNSRRLPDDDQVRIDDAWQRYHAKDAIRNADALNIANGRQVPI